MQNIISRQFSQVLNLSVTCLLLCSPSRETAYDAARHIRRVSVVQRIAGRQFRRAGVECNAVRAVSGI